MIFFLLLLLSSWELLAVEIDWDTCGKDSKCYCLVGTLLTALGPNPSCPTGIGLKTKYLTSNMALFQLQVQGAAYTFSGTATLMMYLKDKELAGCELEDGKIKLIGNDQEKDTYEMKLFEERSSFKDQNIYCAFTIGTADSYKTAMAKNRENQKPSIVFKGKNGQQILDSETNARIGSFFERTLVTCDPYSFKDLSTLPGSIVKSINNRDNEILNCKGHGGSYVMRYGTTTEKGEEIESLKCKPNPKDEFEYNYYVVREGGDPEGEKLDDIENYFVYCTSPLDETCENPYPTACPTCPTFTRGSPGKPAKIECADKKWLINGEYYVLNSESLDEPKCVPQEGKKNSANFITKYPSVIAGTFNEDKSGQERCFTDYDCYKASKLDYPGGCQNETACEIDYSNGMMNCRAADKWLRVIDRKLDKTTTPKSIQCDKSTGKWRDDSGAALNDDVQVRCVGKPKEPEKKAAMDKDTLIAVIGGLVGGGIALSLAILGGMFCWYRVKANKENNVKNGVWKSMDVKEQLEHCKMVFEQASQSTGDSKGRIFHGLRLLSVLLETETVDPEIWEEAYAFLVRIQWTLEKTDYLIGQLFARYMYLEGAKIIDKHGWLAPSPIMSRTDKGLMRVVAIRLLSLAMHTPHSAKDSKRVLEGGFRQLGFNCVEQYPHCGVLWPVMMHNRVYRCTADKSVKFDRVAFIKYLSKCEKMDEFDMKDASRIIPEFGTPIEQAHEAIGAAPINNALTSNTDAIMTAEKTESGSYIRNPAYGMKYFAGMGNTLYRNPSHNIFVAMKMWDCPNEDMLKTMYEMADKAKWMPIYDNIVKLMVYFGRPLDAKKFQTRFTPEVPQPSDLYNQLTVDQTFFEEAVEAQKEELRGWLADHTDLKELKKKPSYTIDPKLEERLNKGLSAATEKMNKMAAAAVVDKDPDTTLENEGNAAKTGSGSGSEEKQPLLLPEADALDPDDKPEPAPAAAAPAAAKPATPAAAAPAPSLKSAKK